MNGEDIALKAIEMGMPLTVPSINRIVKHKPNLKLESLIELEHSKSINSIRNMLIPNGLYQGEIEAGPYISGIISDGRPLVVGVNDPKSVAVINVNEQDAYELAMYITRKYVKGEITYLPRIALTIVKRHVMATEG